MIGDNFRLLKSFKHRGIAKTIINEICMGDCFDLVFFSKSYVINMHSYLLIREDLYILK